MAHSCLKVRGPSGFCVRCAGCSGFCIRLSGLLFCEIVVRVAVVREIVCEIVVRVAVVVKLCAKLSCEVVVQNRVRAVFDIVLEHFSAPAVS